MNMSAEYRLPKYIYDKYIRMIITDGSLEWRYDKYVFRCPICHDSKKNRSKKRGALIVYDDGAIMTCKNCGYSHPLWKVLKENYSSIYSEYSAEVVKIAAGKDSLDEAIKHAKEASGPQAPARPPSVILTAKKVQREPDVKVLQTMNEGRFESVDGCTNAGMKALCISYISKRKIPADIASTFMCCTTGKYDNRLIIPYINQSKYTYFVARDMTGMSPAKYMGLQGVKRPMYMPRLIDWTKTIYILEGEIDSMFIQNSISVGSVHNCSIVIRALEGYGIKDFVFIMDNDKSGYAKASQLSKSGYKTFNWCGFKGKDINECVMNGELPTQSNGTVMPDALRFRTIGNTMGDILRQSLMMQISSREQNLDGYKKAVL